MYELLLIQFYYLIDLHYSQTRPQRRRFSQWFYYLIDLHYSQTTSEPFFQKVMFYYLIDLHYSQTVSIAIANLMSFTTLQIYTILKQTLQNVVQYKVLLPYRFTLFSNELFEFFIVEEFYYLIDLHYSQTTQITQALKVIVLLPYRFTLFSNYTILTRTVKMCFTTLQIYTILKRRM